MKALITFSILLLGSYGLSAQTDFVLDPSQSMLMTGKGPGQDGTINPYDGKDCYAVIESTGDVEFYIRIQSKTEIVLTQTITPGTSEKIILKAGQELYLDPNEKATGNARVSYEPLK